jgi:HEAT repeat protein
MTTVNIGKKYFHAFSLFIFQLLICLLMIGCSKSTNTLIRELTSHQQEDRAYAIEELGKRGDARAVVPLLGVLQSDPSGYMRSLAAEALGMIGDPRAVDGLLSVVTDDHPILRRKAVEALGRIGDPRAEEKLIPLLKDNESFVRSKAAWALGRLKDVRALPFLVAALNDDDKWVRHSAVEALGEIKDPRSVEPLITLIADKDPDVQRRAVGVLWKMTGNDFGRDQERWRGWWIENKGKFQNPAVFKEFAEMNAKKWDESVNSAIERRGRK